MKFESFFSGIKAANDAVEKLKAQGFDAYVDLNDHYQINTDVNTKDFSFLSTTSNADLVLNSGTPSGSSGRSPLLAASPMVSGMGSFEEIADINYKVLVDVPQNKKSNAESIITSLGGTMQSPNVEIEKHVKDVNLDEVDLNLFDD
jgi:hypothetical protein